MNSKPLASSTGMNSQQIRCLSESAHAVWMTIAELLNLLDKANKAPEADPVYTWGITQEIKNLAKRDPDHNYYRDWFATWNTQMVLATNRFLHVARSTDRIPS
ncbi:hypothetical protein KEM48_000887 [Puccinia striiformis f. sp. tritici PST-130]|nr:hypothetical protein KEM48_000887 [Puccinia striiformis f. sp. tritici PST-130]